ncbi:MAG: DUF1016 domain-containing protein [Ignavibacteriales bacterium]|nr:MAG: DUF1016 domain-containing protein [Ignavibacteriales bacterium]
MKALSKNIYIEVKSILEKARSNAYRAVNFAMVQAYWQIGKIIVEEEQSGKKKAGYGEHLIIELSGRLTEDFGKGFSIANVKNIRQFYLTFSNSYALRSELTWTHYRFSIRVEKDVARKFYLNESIECGWSTRQLERQINSFYFERILTSKNKSIVKKESQKRNEVFKPEDIIKDPYVPEFIGLNPNSAHLEKDLENSLLLKLQDFLLELGKGFSFVSRQKHIAAEDDHFFIDLVFYNYFTKCFVLFDLKVGKLTHQDIGQMDFYVRCFEKNIRQSSDNPTIGIILCTEKNETIVKYSILKGSKRIFASVYKLYLPSEQELIKEIENQKLLLGVSSFSKVKSSKSSKRK